jgi:signal transduction histidine kinase
MALDSPSKLLLVGPDHDRLVNLRSLLESSGLQVFLAHSAPSARDLLREYEFAATLVDETAMNEDDVRNAEEILTDKSTRKVPVIRLARSVSRHNLEQLLSPLVPVGELLFVNHKTEESIEEIRRSNKALQEYCWAVSHDLTEPLRGIQLYSQMLDQTLTVKMNEKERDAFARLCRNAQNMKILLDSLLQYVRASESSEIVSSRVDCNRVMETVVSLLQQTITESGGKVLWEELPVIEANEMLLTHILQNLVSNALKYRSDESPDVRITCELRRGGYLFAVRDNGIGIKAEYLEYVFKPLKRLNKHDSEGAGLGLALCRNAVQRLGGRIWADSDGKKGSVFYFTVAQASAKPIATPHIERAKTG